jgi:hypothetical protein
VENSASWAELKFDPVLALWINPASELDDLEPGPGVVANVLRCGLVDLQLKIYIEINMFLTLFRDFLRLL